MNQTNPFSFLEGLRSRLGFKISLFTLLALLLTAGILIVVSNRLAVSLGDEAAKTSEASILQHAYQYLEAQTYDRAKYYHALLKRTAALSAMITNQTAILLEDPAKYRRQLRPEEELTFYENKGMYFNAKDAPMSLLYLASETPPEDIQMQLEAVVTLEPTLNFSIENSESATASWVILENGIAHYYPGIPMAEILPPLTEYDLRQSQFYTVVDPEHNPGRETRWSDVLQDPAGAGLIVSVCSPIYSKKGIFLGVAGIDVTLDNMVKEILNPHITVIDQQLVMLLEFSFMLNTNGNIIAFPPDRLELFGFAKHEDIEMGQLLETSVLESTIPGVRQLSQKVIDSGEGELSVVEIKGENFLVGYHPLPETGWIYGSVISEQEILQSVEQTRKGISVSSKKMSMLLTWILLFSIIVTFLVTTAFILYRVVNPLKQMTTVAREVEKGNYSTRLQINQQDEIGELADTFNNMVAHLEDYRQNLESKVEERTIELRSREKAFRRLFESSLDAIVLFSTENIIDCNERALEIFKCNSRDAFLELNLEALSPEKQPNGRLSMDLTRKGLDRAIEGQGAFFEWTHRRLDGSTFIAEVLLSPMEFQGQNVVQGVIRDISDRKQVENELQGRLTELGRSRRAMLNMMKDLDEAKKEAEAATKAIKESEDRVKIILDSINTGIIIINPQDRTIVDANPIAEQMIGLPKKEIVGNLCHKFICPREMNDCPIIDHDQTVDNADRVLLNADGQAIPILKTVVKVNLGGKLHFVESFVDLTESKQAEEELRRNLEELERFNKLTINREEKMIALKEEINQLMIQLGKGEKYKIVEVAEPIDPEVKTL